MSFASPVFLLALLLVPPAVLAYLVAGRRRQRFAVRYTVLETLERVAASVPGRRRHVPAALAALAAAALVLALARPQMSVAVPVERASIMLVTDVSGSMNSGDVSPTRIAAAQAAATKFVGKVPARQRVGLVAFSDTASVLQTPTTDHAAVRTTIDSLSAQGATSTGEALQVALDQLKAKQGEPQVPGAIVLLSDGKRTAGPDPVPVARAAAKLGIPIYTISLGTAGGVLRDPNQPGMSQPVPPDPATMRAIASAAHGQAYTVADAAKLSRIYERLGSRLGTKTEDREVTAGFAGAGLLLLAAAVGLGLRRRVLL